METLNLTQLETNFLTTLMSNLHEIDFSDMTVQDISDETGISTNVLRGVQSSLVKKGIISVHDNGEGFQIIYLNEKYYYLHPNGWVD